MAMRGACSTTPSPAVGRRRRQAHGEGTCEAQHCTRWRRGGAAAATGYQTAAANLGPYSYSWLTVGCIISSTGGCSACQQQR